MIKRLTCFISSIKLPFSICSAISCTTLWRGHMCLWHKDSEKKQDKKEKEREKNCCESADDTCSNVDYASILFVGQQLQFCFNITDKFSLLKCSKLAPIILPPIAILDIIIIMFGMPVRLQTQNLFQLLLQAPVFFSKSVDLLSLWRLNW